MLRSIIKGFLMAAACSKRLRTPRGSLGGGSFVILRPWYCCQSALLLLLTLHSPFHRLLLKATYAQNRQSRTATRGAIMKSAWLH